MAGSAGGLYVSKRSSYLKHPHPNLPPQGRRKEQVADAENSS